MYTVAVVNNTLEETPPLFIINMIIATPIDNTQIGISYRGKANPPLVCDITVTEYSLDNKKWYPMTLELGSDITDIPLTNRWDSFLITWDALFDILDYLQTTWDPSDTDDEGKLILSPIYNRVLYIRFRATSGNEETELISYRLFFKNPIMPIFKNTSNRYQGISRYSILEQAPKVF